FSWPQDVQLPGYHPVTKPHSKQIKEAARLLASARRPVLYAGGGVIRADASAELRRLVDLSGAPVVTTLMARGAVPDTHPQNLGMPGMHGTVPAVAALQKADLVVSLGARFDDRVTGALSSFAPHAQVVHADIDPAEIGKNRDVDVPIVGDLKEVISDLLPELEREHEAKGKPDVEAWWRQIDDWRETYPLGYSEPEDGHLAPQYVISRLGELSGPESIYVAGVGQHQMWAAQFIRYEHPRTWLNSGGLGTMGFSVPAAMGAKVGRPDATVWAIDGDGCFQMTNQELATCTINEICSKFLINQKYTSSKHLYAMGGSAGGLLVGAVINMAPELYNGAVLSVPFVDVLTTMLDDSIPLTTGEYDEWGNPNEKKFYDYIKSYSPYDNVITQDYPNILVTTGLHDSQVQYWEPAKWVAKLRELKTDNNILLLHTNMDAGHGGASGRFEALKEVAEDYAFILDLEGINE